MRSLQQVCAFPYLSVCFSTPCFRVVNIQHSKSTVGARSSRVGVDQIGCPHVGLAPPRPGCVR
jgi:hypothetical protein